jgi:hypothetical protein
VPAAAIFQFITGARKEARAAFPELAKSQIFNSKDSETIAFALQRAEDQLRGQGSVPSQQDLAVKFGTRLTERQLVEILGFIAPTKDSEAYKEWEAAIGKMSEGTLEKKILEERRVFEGAVFSKDNIM